MAIETVSTQFINQTFIDKVYGGHIKEAMDASSTFVRQKLREEGFARKILPPQLVTAADLDRDLVDQPRVIVEKEPDSTAASFGLSGQPEIRYFTAARYAVNFYKVAGEDYRKSKYELATYKANIQQILQENQVKDLQRQEDTNFMNGLWAIAIDGNSGNPGVQDYTSSSTGFGINTLMNAVAIITNQQQKPGKILMPYTVYMKLLTRQARIVGDVAATEALRGTGLNNFYGFEIITTNKHDLLTSANFSSGQFGNATASTNANYGNMVVVTAPEAYFGQFYSLQEPTVFIETRADMIEFQTYESVGIGIGNTKGFVIAKFDLTVDSDFVWTKVHS